MERPGVLWPQTSPRAIMTALRTRANRGIDRSPTDQRHADGPDLHGVTRKLRCAIYTRKSSEEGLQMEFNSLDAQREACMAYIESQKAEGWRALPKLYDDGGYSGGSMDRPALQALLSDVAGGLVDVIVVYKVDRLTRSLSDFAKIVDILEQRNV